MASGEAVIAQPLTSRGGLSIGVRKLAEGIASPHRVILSTMRAWAHSHFLGFCGDGLEFLVDRVCFRVFGLGFALGCGG
jgi:hypothetical protein